MKLPDKIYQHVTITWLALGMLMLDGYGLYRLFTSSFEFSYLFIVWLFIGANIVIFYILTNVWDEDFSTY